MKRPRITKQNRVALYAISVILLLFFFSWWGIDHFITNIDNRGTFGDKFGAVNSLFSGLAVAGLIYTIYLQKEELRLQREELRQTREEMSRQTKEFDEQNKNLQIQRFETTFFNMIGFLQEIIQGLSVDTTRLKPIKYRDPSGKFRRDFPEEEVTLKGIPVFEETYITTKICLKNNIQKNGIEGYNESKGNSLYDHYFRYLFRIMTFIDTSSSISDFRTRYQYMAMLRDQLSCYELIWLYYTGLSNKGQEMRPLIEKYAMLKHLRKGLIVDTDKYVGEYLPSAFGFKS